MRQITEEDLKLIKQIWLKARSRVISLKKIRNDYYKERASYEQFIRNAHDVISSLSAVNKQEMDVLHYDLNDLRLQILKLAQNPLQTTHVKETLFKLLAQNDS